MEPEQNVGNALNTEFAPGTNFSPPQSQEEFQQRRAGWKGVLDQIQSDPNLQGMVLRMGLRMMQPMPTGQSTGGHIAGAVEDSLDWLGAQRELQRKAGLEERKVGLDERRGGAAIEHTGAQTKAVQQEVEQKGEAFPLDVDAKKLKVQGLQTEQKKLDAMAAAGMFTPEYFILQQKLETDKSQAYTDMLRGHAEAYRAAGGKGDKTPKTNTIDLADGSKGVVTTRLINGTPYHSLMIPPTMSDPSAAAAMVDKEISKETGKWFGKPNFAPLTAEQYRAKRVQELTQPRVIHMDSSSGVIPKLPGEAAAPQLSTRDKNLKSSVAMQPGEVVDPGMAASDLTAELTNINAQIAKERQGTPKMVGLVAARSEIQQKLQALESHGTNELVAPGNGAAPGLLGPQATPASGGRQVIRVEGEPGNLRVAGQPTAQPSGFKPGLLQQARAYQEGPVTENKKAQAKVRLTEVRAKQKLGVPLSQGDREVLALLGESE